MIFMSQSGLTDWTRKSDWHAWYVEHLRIMATVPGIASAERFETDQADWPPSLAMYSIASAAVFDAPYYQKIRGMGEWLPLIDKRFYKRNLFDGADTAPTVPRNSLLLVTDQVEPLLQLDGVTITWLQSVGLDRSTPYRGIAVVTRDLARALTAQPGFALHRPAGTPPLAP